MPSVVPDDEDEARQVILRWQRAWSAEASAFRAVTRDDGLVGRTALMSMDACVRTPRAGTR